MKKKHPEHVNLERWLVSYADFITLLFAFFVVMYSMANQDKAKIKQITESIEKAFMGPASKTDLGSGTNISTFSSRTSPMGLLLDQPVGYNNALPKPNPELERIAQRIEESLSYQLQNTDLKDHLRLIYDDRGLIIRFSAGELFEPGSADVKTKHLPTIDAIGNIIADGQRLLRVEGHTDSSPITNNPKFDTNWELSSARAAWIVRYLKAKWKIPSSRLAAAGYADGQPVASNKTEEGRARNRRVEIVVTNVIDRSQN